MRLGSFLRGGVGFGADVGRVQEAGRLVEHAFDEGEAEFFENALGGAVVGVVSGIDFRQPQLPPAVIERALCRFHCETLAPAALHMWKPNSKFASSGV